MTILVEGMQHSLTLQHALEPPDGFRCHRLKYDAIVAIDDDHSGSGHDTVLPSQLDGYQDLALACDTCLHLDEVFCDKCDAPCKVRRTFFA